MEERRSGILLPLFSLRSRTDFGVGDFGALDGLFSWMKAARQRVLMLLPLLPTLPADSSPYATRSAFGLNPLFIDLDRVPDFVESRGIQSLSDEERKRLDQARQSQRIRYPLVFELKGSALRRAFQHFRETHWRTDGARAKELKRYMEEQALWLASFALFAAISAEQQHRPWWEWPEGLRFRDPAQLENERGKLADEILFHSWQQWIAEIQWQEVRAAARRSEILLCGDEPFIVGQDSADTWANPTILRRDGRLGVPADDFSSTGQDWGLPYFHFAAMESTDFGWLRARATKTAAYYDLRRVDHAVGYFRQWVRDERNPIGRFLPPDEPTQRAWGERHFRILSSYAKTVAEDLGIIPQFVRETLTRLSIPGYRVLRWEQDQGVYRNPHDFPELSVVTTGSHDTETLREWWENLPDHERSAVARAYPELRDRQVGRSFTPELHQWLLAAAENAGSQLCILPWQDILGSRDRINLPGSMTEANWSYRTEEFVDEYLIRDETRVAAQRLAQLTEMARR